MRTEVKIAAAVALAVVVLGVVWYFTYYRPAQTPPEQAANTPGNSSGTNIIESPDPGTAAGGGATTSGEGTTAPPPAGGTGTIADGAAGTGAGTPGGTSFSPGSTLGGTPAATTRNYVVQLGDSYRSIAQREYGDGTLASVLEKANPNIPSWRLAPGLTVKVPPKPDASILGGGMGTSLTGGLGAAGAAATPGAVGTDPVTGKKFYVVKQGDNGFSGVARVTLGDGKHWQLIEKANPGVDSRKLRPGQKLWVPEKPVEPTGLTAGLSSATPTTEGIGAGLPRSSVTVRIPARPATASVTPARGTGAAAAAPSAVGRRTGAPVRSTRPDGSTFD